MDNWDFDCPQFVDFAAALNSPSNEIFYDVSSDQQVAATNQSDNLGPKMATPKIKPNDPLKNFPFINFSTDDEKLATLSKLPARLSRSDGQLDQIIKSLKSPGEKENPRIPKSKRRTSFSVNYIRKKRICPTTPNCLKRTVNSKFKNAKTSEELELQKIAELQNMLHKHLRLNQINLKRLKMNKAPFTLEKLPKKKEPKPNVPTTKSNLFAPKSVKSYGNFQRKNACRGTAFSQEVKEQVVPAEKTLNVVTKKNSNALRDLNVFKKDCGNSLKKLPLLKKYDAHGGLKFLPHKDTTMPCPFTFDTSYVSSHNASLQTNLSKIHSSLSVSRNTPCVLDNKENLVE